MNLKGETAKINTFRSLLLCKSFGSRIVNRRKSSVSDSVDLGESVRRDFPLKPLVVLQPCLLWVGAEHWVRSIQPIHTSLLTPTTATPSCREPVLPFKESQLLSSPTEG